MSRQEKMNGGGEEKALGEEQMALGRVLVEVVPGHNSARPTVTKRLSVGRGSGAAQQPAPLSSTGSPTSSVLLNNITKSIGSGPFLISSCS